MPATDDDDCNITSSESLLEDLFKHLAVGDAVNVVEHLRAECGAQVIAQAPRVTT